MGALKDIGLFLSLGTNLFLLWFITRRARADPGASPPAGSAPVAVPDRPLPDDDLARVRNELRAGRMIEAIKIYRQATGCGLAEAKRAVEALKPQ